MIPEPLPDFPDPSAGFCRFYLWMGQEDELCALLWQGCLQGKPNPAPSEPSLPSVSIPHLFWELFGTPEDLGTTGAALSLHQLNSLKILSWACQIFFWNLLAAVLINSQAMFSNSFQTCPKNWHKLFLCRVPFLSEFLSNWKSLDLVFPPGKENSLGDT